ncbi:MAG TPA: MauE/DoxX family redox-associated membrane protein [Chitinophaga sp.]|nr:MauE/DoxX family redox-associated membrane protein [Chitinophaga sp.]
MKARDLILLTCYFLFTSMYLYAAVSKLMLHQVFMLQMKVQPLPEVLTPVLGWGIPITEIIISLMMMTISFRKLGLYLATGLMICFTAYIVLVKMNMFDKIPCSCGGAISTFTWTQHLIFNLFFVVIGITGIYLEHRSANVARS